MRTWKPDPPSSGGKPYGEEIEVRNLSKLEPAFIEFTNAAGELVFRIEMDGRVEFGPGFTTPDEASRQFIEALGVSVGRVVSGPVEG